jgi:hypothetical protein
MTNPETVEKLKVTLKRIGHKVKPRGGNGKPIPEPQEVLMEYLGAGWKSEFAVSCGRPTPPTFPKCYKIDVAHPALKIAIEVDGGSHNSTLARYRDPKKDGKLTELGWKVLRFSNKEILAWRDSGHPTDASISMILQRNSIPHIP